MKLQLKNSVVDLQCAAGQHILVKHDLKTKTTTIDCNMDIVSVGIAIEVLKQLYDERLAQLDASTSLYIHSVIKEAVE